jgi:hypothetical protein
MLVLPHDNISLLHIAAYYDNLEVFLFLVTLAESSPGSLTLRTPSGASYLPLHYACYDAARECTAYILEQDPEQAAMQCECPWQPVFLATCAKSSEILQMLFDVKDPPVDLRSPKNAKNQPFALALKNGAHDCLLLLLQKSCKTDVDGYNLSPLMVAVSHQAEAALEPLLDLGLDPYFVSMRGDTVLSLACVNGDLRSVRLLCDRMDYIEINATEMNFSSIVRSAVASGSLDVLKTVLTKGDVEVNRYDSAEEQPVDAIRGESKISDDLGLKMLKMLIEFGYNINSRHPKTDKCFFDRLIEFTPMAYPKIVEFLLESRVEARHRFNITGTTTLDLVKGWKDKKYARPTHIAYLQIFARYFPGEIQLE